MSHTPGPWKARQVEGGYPYHDGERHFSLSTVDGRGIADVYGDNAVWIGADEAPSNAALIAAAPLMLEALEELDEVLSIIVAQKGLDRLLKNVRAAISAARATTKDGEK